MEGLLRTLSDAAKKGNSKTMKTLLQSGSNVQYLVEKGNLLHLAASFGHSSVVKGLVEVINY